MVALEDQYTYQMCNASLLYIRPVHQGSYITQSTLYELYRCMRLPSSAQKEALCGQVQLRAEHRPAVEYRFIHLLNSNQTLLKLHIGPGEEAGVCSLTDDIPFPWGIFQPLLRAVMLHVFISHFWPEPS